MLYVIGSRAEYADAPVVPFSCLAPIPPHSFPLTQTHTYPSPPKQNHRQFETRTWVDIQAGDFLKVSASTSPLVLLWLARAHVAGHAHDMTRMHGHQARQSLANRTHTYIHPPPCSQIQSREVVCRADIILTLRIHINSTPLIHPPFPPSTNRHPHDTITPPPTYAINQPPPHNTLNHTHPRAYTRTSPPIQIQNREVVPADVILVGVHEPEPDAPDGICYLETKSLDGETNLKLR